MTAARFTLADVLDALNRHRPRGDKPRKIVVCSPDQFAEVHRAVMDLHLGDVLVQSNRYVDAGQVFILDAAALELGPVT